MSGFEPLSLDEVLKRFIKKHGNIYDYKETDFFHKNISFEECQLRDKIKRNFFYKNNIKLLEILFWEMNNIDKILRNELKL